MFCRDVKKIAAAVAVAMLGASAANAESVSDEIKQINEKIAKQSAQLEDLDQQAKILAKQQEIARMLAAPKAGSTQGLPQTDEVPVVRGIEGVDGKLRATLVMRGGVTQTVKVGEKFGGWTTKEITVNSVTLVHGKETVRLAFGTEPAAGGYGSSGTWGSPAGFGSSLPGSPAIPGSPAGAAPYAGTR